MAILYGTQSNGETLPVQVNELGQLVAKGVDGPPGPIGPPGIGELPPGATDGALLGWENGELVWITESVPLPPVDNGFRSIIYTGSSELLEVTGLGFKPSLVWIKQRNGTGQNVLFRGAETYLVSNSNEPQRYNGNSLQSFTDDGFTLGTEGFVNGSASNTYVAWCWRASDTNVTNNEGTIESQVRSNGNFSIVNWSGNGAVASIGHGLNESPAMLILKSLGEEYWYVYHKGLDPNGSGDKVINLNRNGRLDTSSAFWNSTVPTSSVFTVGPDGGTAGANDFIAYAWAETPGESKFGSYQSTGTRTMIPVGFSPSLVIIKSTSTEGDWFMFDNARGTQYALRANETVKEDEIAIVEFLSEGFQLLFAFPGVNTENETYIYAAFANPADAANAKRQLRRQARQEQRQESETPLR